ncbi:MAG: glycerol-3-phosphate dehydrogenase, partial [Bacteroidales bacterium]|nr:glycerol-3-phosphate dehydrogenase [Bacteroidales bacterium]
ALAKILLENLPEISWYFHKDDNIRQFKQLKHNPGYLRGVEFDTSRIKFTSDINKIAADCDTLVIAIPSAFLKNTLNKLTVDISSKFVVSGIKGLVPDEKMIIGEYLHNTFKIPYESIGVLAGPCHAEEVALERLSYLTVACSNETNAAEFAKLLQCGYIRAKTSDDIWGTEYSSVLKNIVAIAAGIVHGLMYGDNFQAVLISNAIQEIERFVNTVHPIIRDIKSSVYLGDLMVTAYSQFSRNRTFGIMIGKGYSIKNAQLEMFMVAEGYYSAKSIMEINERYKVDIPICNATYQILYMNQSPQKEIKRLTDKLM